MAVADPKPHSEPKVWNFFKLPFRHSTSATTTTSSSANLHLHHHHHHHNPNNLPLEGSTSHTSNSVSSVARSLLPTRRRLKLDPSNKLYLPCINSSPPYMVVFLYVALLACNNCFHRDLIWIFGFNFYLLFLIAI